MNFGNAASLVFAMEDDLMEPKLDLLAASPGGVDGELARLIARLDDGLYPLADATGGFGEGLHGALAPGDVKVLVAGLADVGLVAHRSGPQAVTEAHHSFARSSNWPLALRTKRHAKWLASSRAVYMPIRKAGRISTVIQWSPSSHRATTGSPFPNCSGRSRPS